MIKLFTTTMALFLLIAASAQKADFTGTWILKDKKSLSGTLYSNALPQLIKIIQTKDMLTLETNEEQQFPTDIVGTEKLKMNGQTWDTTLGKKKTKRTTAIKFDKEGKTCTRTSSLYQEDGKNIYVTYTDVMSLENGNFILQRKGENFTNGEVWEAWSVYEKQ